MAGLVRGMGQALAELRNKTAVPYIGRRESTVQLGGGSARGRSAPGPDELAAMEAVSTLFAIVNMEATSVARWDWALYRKARSGKKDDRTEVTTPHPATVIWNKPNNFMTRMELMTDVQQHVDLTGEGYVLIARTGDVATELWPVRPDRMRAVKSPTDFISGYVYTGPDGEQVPLEIRDVMMIRAPHPLDPYHGLSPVRSLMTDLQAADMAAEWNRNFFKNSAEPGGVIEYPEELDPAQFKTIVRRWREQHQGVNNAHRVAIIEGGKWVPRVYTRKDMEFTSMRTDIREVIREAFAFPKLLLGTGEDSNRATAEAMAYTFGFWHTAPRLDRWKGLLNNDFLLAIGVDPEQYEFDYPYEDVVPSNRELDDRELATRSNAVKTLIETGFDAAQALEVVGLPPMLFSKPEPPAAPAAGTPGGASAPFARGPRNSEGAYGIWMETDPLGAARPYRLPLRAAAEEVDAIDLSEVEDDYQGVLAALLADWGSVVADQRDELERAVRALVDEGKIDKLGDLDCAWRDGAGILLAAMLALGALAAQQVVREATRQGVGDDEIQATVPPRATFRRVADATAQLLARGMAMSAGREALRVHGEGVSGAQVADKVRAHLAALTDAIPRETLGGALTGAQNMARVETLRTGPEGAVYASEQLDKSTCKPCREVHGRWLGNISNMTMIDQTYPQGAYGGYRDCQGGSRCRGTVVGVWRPKTVGGNGS